MKRIVAGNWKMNHGVAATRSFLREFRPADRGGEVQVLLFPPTTSLAAAAEALGDGSGISLGVQQIHPSPSGAFTGEISAEMAAEAGAGFVLVGHSERRQLFHETDEGTRLRVAAAYRAALCPVLCVGETLEERRGGSLSQVLHRQLDTVLSDPDIGTILRTDTPFVLAYEPVWAIGTGETATPSDAAEAHAILRLRLALHLGEARAEVIPILYGGSVSAGNAGELMAAPGVNGVLVGGASLKPDSFAAIVAAA